MTIEERIKIMQDKLADPATTDDEKRIINNVLQIVLQLNT